MNALYDVDGGIGRPPRILHCLWRGNIGGAERAVYQLVREQLRVGSVLPSVLFSGGGGPWVERMRQLGCPVVVLGMPTGSSPRHLTSACEPMRPFDIHHFHVPEPLLMASSLRCRGVKRVYTHRGGQTEYSLKKRGRYRLTGALVRRGFHGMSGNTAHGARCGAYLLHISPARFSVTYNGIDFSLLEPRREPAAVRAELGIRSTDFVIGTASILNAPKRIERLLYLVAALDQPHVRLVIVGDGPERLALERIARDHNIAAQICFTGLRQDVPDYLQIMDAFCLPTRGESFGNAAVEAMGLGVPTLVFSDGGGLTEHVDNGTTGFIVGDQGELEDATRLLIQDPVLRENIGSRGRYAVRERYTPQRSAAAYDRLYDAVLPHTSWQAAPDHGQERSVPASNTTA